MKKAKSVTIDKELIPAIEIIKTKERRKSFSDMINVLLHEALEHREKLVKK